MGNPHGDFEDDEEDAASARYAAFLEELDAMADERRPESPEPIDGPHEEDVVPLIAIAPDEGEEGDVVVAMQELLLRHEQTSLNRVEDPDLERVLQELRGIAHSNIADIFEMRVVSEYIGLDNDEQEIWQQVERLCPKDITRLPREISACIQSIKITRKPEGDVIEVKMYDKQISLDKLMRFHGAYVRDNEQVADANRGAIDLILSSIGSQGLPVITDNSA